MKLDRNLNFCIHIKFAFWKVGQCKIKCSSLYGINLHKIKNISSEIDTFSHFLKNLSIEWNCGLLLIFRDMLVLSQIFSQLASIKAYIKKLRMSWKRNRIVNRLLPLIIHEIFMARKKVNNINFSVFMLNK